MARTIKVIQQAITADLTARRPGLSSSNVAEWRLWVWVVATAIHLFEVILDQFRAEIDAAADKITPGTVRWYIDQCKRFQNKHKLLFNSDTAQMYYETDDPASRIVSVVSVREDAKKLTIKAAKMSEAGKIVPLTADELHNFTGYVESIKFAGMETVVISRTADAIRYTLTVYYDPVVPATTVRDTVQAQIDAFRTSLDFNSMFYSQKFVAAIMSVEGVVTVDLQNIERKGTSMEDFAQVAVAEELEAGYFDYADGCVLNLVSIKANEHES